MSTRLRQIGGAVLMVMLFLTFGGSFLEGASYLVVIKSEHVLETLGLAPMNWGEAHGGILLTLSLLAVLPLVAVLGVRLYRSALAVERELTPDE